MTVTNIITSVLSSNKALTAFSFSNPGVVGTIDETNKTVAVTVPFGTDISALVANFTVSSRATVKIGSVAQVSGNTSHNFSSPVVYQVIAEDGSTADYTVTVTITGPTVVSSLDLSSLVTAPVKGAAPITTAIDQTQYTSGAISWFEADGATPIAGNFAAAKVYVAKLTLVAKTGYTLTGVTANSFTYTSAASVANVANSGAVTITFAATADAVVDALNLTTLVTAPVKGAAPVTTAIDQTQYTSGAISWFETDGTTPVAGNFTAAKVYVAKLTLVAKTGYTLTGVTANSFTYTGAASVANAANSGAVTITFAATALEPVTAIGAIAGTPKSGQTLTAGALTPTGATADYKWQVSNDGSSSWSDVSGETANTYLVDLGKTAVGKYVRVVATGKGTCSGTVYSSARRIWATDYTSANIGTLRYVPAGSFQRDATPANVSTITKGFRMSQYEITRQQFNSIMGSDPSNTGVSDEFTEPVQQANWYHAIAFCNKLSIAEGLTPAYAVSGVNFSTLTYAAIPTSANANWTAATCDWSATGYRLPTEMEWMWAAMGADTANPDATNTTGYNKAFAGSNGSNSIDDYAWYSDTSSNMTHPVGGKQPNELGLYDMTGNVWEWCWDWQASYPAGSISDYYGTDTGTYRIIRGGSWKTGTTITVSTRGSDYGDWQDYAYGFRVIRP